MMTLIMAAALAAPPAPTAQGQMPMQQQQDPVKKDCCKDCCKDMDAKHADHSGEHGHSAQ